MPNENDNMNNDPSREDTPDPPLMIPTRGGRRASDDPAAPGVKASSTLTWLIDMMSRQAVQDVEKIKPSKSDVSNAGPSQFVNATSRLESGHFGQNERSEASLINPVGSPVEPPVEPPAEPALAESIIEPLEPVIPSPAYRFPPTLPTADTGLTSTAVPSLPSRPSIATSHGISLENSPESDQDPDETVSLSYFAHPPRRYHSDADIARSDGGSNAEDSNDMDYDIPFDYNGANPAGQVDERSNQDETNDINSPIYTASCDSFSILEQEMAENRRARVLRELEAHRAARFKEAQEAANAEPLQSILGPSTDGPRRTINFNLPAPPEPEKWTKGLTRGLSRLFGREPRATPDLELGQRIPYALKGKQRADPPKLKPKPLPNPLDALRRLSRPRESFIDLETDHGSPLRLPTPLAGVTRKLSFKRPSTAPHNLEMSPEIKRDPFAKDLILQDSVLPTVMPKRMSVYERFGAATRALSTKRRIIPIPENPNLSKVERILGTDLGTYKSSTRSYPDLLMPAPRPHPSARPTSFAGLPIISHPFRTAGSSQHGESGKWFKGLTRPRTADDSRKPSWSGGSIEARHGSTRKDSVASHESVVQKLERMVSRASSQLEPGSPPHTGQSSAPTLYPDGIDPVVDPELYALVRRWQMHRRVEEERRLHSSQGDTEQFITANAFPLPPSPPPRQSSLGQPTGLLSPGWAPTSPALHESTAQKPLFTSALRPSPPATAGYEPLDAIHPSPAPDPKPNALGLSTSSSRVSFAPSPPRHSHIDLKDFLLSSPSQILRTTSATELHRPHDGPLIPDFPAAYDDLDHLALFETDVWRRVDQHWASRGMEILWQSPYPKYTWSQYHLVLTTAQRPLNLDSDEIPADVEMEICLHLFKIYDEATRWRSDAVDFGKRRFADLYSPEVTRRIVTPTTVISTFQPYTAKGWKEEDAQIDMTKICDGDEHVWYLELPDLETHNQLARYLDNERDCLIAANHGCGVAYRDQITHTPHTPNQRTRILAEEIAAASARWDTRRLALENDTPPPSPIRPAPRLPIATPSKSILKRRTSTGEVRKVSPFGAWSSIQGYLHELEAWRKGNDLEKSCTEERLESERIKREARLGGGLQTGAIGIESTPALTDQSLPETDVQSPPEANTALPLRPTSPDSPGQLRSARSDPDELDELDLTEFMHEFDASRDDEYMNPDYDTTQPPPPPEPTGTGALDVDTCPLPSHFQHLQPTTDVDVPRYSHQWPYYGRDGPYASTSFFPYRDRCPPSTPAFRVENGIIIPTTAHMSQVNDGLRRDPDRVPIARNLEQEAWGAVDVNNTIAAQVARVGNLALEQLENAQAESTVVEARTGRLTTAQKGKGIAGKAGQPQPDPPVKAPTKIILRINRTLQPPPPPPPAPAYTIFPPLPADHIFKAPPPRTPLFHGSYPFSDLRQTAHLSEIDGSKPSQPEPAKEETALEIATRLIGTSRIHSQGVVEPGEIDSRLQGIVALGQGLDENKRVLDGIWKERGKDKEGKSKENKEKAKDKGKGKENQAPTAVTRPSTEERRQEDNSLAPSLSVDSNPPALVQPFVDTNPLAALASVHLSEPEAIHGQSTEVTANPIKLQKELEQRQARWNQQILPLDARARIQAAVDAPGEKVDMTGPRQMDVSPVPSPSTRAAVQSSSVTHSDPIIPTPVTRSTAPILPTPVTRSTRPILPSPVTRSNVPILPSPLTRSVFPTQTPALVKQRSQFQDTETPDLITPALSLSHSQTLTLAQETQATPSRPSKAKTKREDDELMAPRQTRAKSRLSQEKEKQEREREERERKERESEESAEWISPYGTRSKKDDGKA